jgi:hypothetical protein
MGSADAEPFQFCRNFSGGDLNHLWRCCHWSYPFGGNGQQGSSWRSHFALMVIGSPAWTEFIIPSVTWAKRKNYAPKLGP